MQEQVPLHLLLLRFKALSPRTTPERGPHTQAGKLQRRSRRSRCTDADAGYEASMNTDAIEQRLAALERATKDLQAQVRDLQAQLEQLRAQRPKRRKPDPVARDIGAPMQTQRARDIEL